MVQVTTHRSACMALALWWSLAALCQLPPGILWQHSYGGSANDFGMCVIPTLDGGHVLSGSTLSDDGAVNANQGDWDVWVLKLDAQGELEWQRTYGGTNSDQARSIVQTGTGDYLVAGMTHSTNGDVSGNQGLGDAWVLKLDAAGNILWQRTYGGTANDEAWDIATTPDGGAILLCQTYSTDGDVSGALGAGDTWLVKLDAAGAMQWQRCYGGSVLDEGWSIQVSAFHGYYVAGSSTSADGDLTGNWGQEDVWVMRLSDTGGVLWQRNLGGSDRDVAYAVRETAEGGCILAGETYSSDGDVTANAGVRAAWAVVMDANGALVWERTHGATGFVGALDLELVPGGGYVLTGEIVNGPQADLWVMRIDGAGNTQWEGSLGGTDDEVGRCIRPTPDGGYVLCGHSLSDDGDLSGNLGWYDVWVLKLGMDLTGIHAPVSTGASIVLHPAQLQLQITRHEPEGQETLTLIDASGRIVMQDRMGGPTHILSLSGLPAGAYMLSLGTFGDLPTFKFSLP